MKFISELITGKQIIPLIAFYCSGRFVLTPDFLEFLRQVTIDNETVEINETFFRHKNERSVMYHIAIKELGETSLDGRNPEDRLEARKRLGILAVFLEEQLKTEYQELSASDHVQIFAFFESSLSMGVFWDFKERKPCCDFGQMFYWDDGCSFWSRNKAAEKPTLVETKEEY